MTALTLQYRRNTDPNQGLATAGVFLIKFLLAIPHFVITSALSSLANAVAYIGFWIVAFTGEMPQATHRFAELSFGWSARTYAWVFGLDDAYPPFETDPEYSAAFPVAKPENPSTGWAVAGLLLFPKVVAAIPHIIALAFLAMFGVIAVWFGFVVTAITGRYPDGIQDFVAGIMQWGLRLSAWFMGLTDEYPPFSLQVTPTA